MKISVAIIALLLAGMPVATPVALAGSYDGSWKVSRTSSNCRPKSVISIRVKRGKISGSYVGGSGRHKISGSVSSNGSFRFSAQSLRDRVNFKGKISGKAGKGRWNVSGKPCNGSLRVY
jgi:hypothetical protein